MCNVHPKENQSPSLELPERSAMPQLCPGHAHTHCLHARASPPVCVRVHVYTTGLFSAVPGILGCWVCLVSEWVYDYACAQVSQSSGSSSDTFVSSLERTGRKAGSWLPSQHRGQGHTGRLGLLCPAAPIALSSVLWYWGLCSPRKRGGTVFPQGQGTQKLYSGRNSQHSAPLVQQETLFAVETSGHGMGLRSNSLQTWPQNCYTKMLKN